MTGYLCFFVWLLSLGKGYSTAFSVLCFLAWLSSIND